MRVFENSKTSPNTHLSHSPVNSGNLIDGLKRQDYL